MQKELIRPEMSQATSIPIEQSSTNASTLTGLSPAYMLKSIVIMMGIPGAGKSTWALRNVQNIGSSSVVLCSADHYMVDGNGHYDWRADRVYRAYQEALRCFERALRDPAVETIVLDNTNVRSSTLRSYVKLIGEGGHRVTVVLIEADPEKVIGRSIHAVPRSRVLKMHAQLQQTLSSGLPPDWKLVRVQADITQSPQ